MIDCDVLVIGAGFAGLSTAYHLAKAGVRRIVIVEKEKKLGGHASGRNAGMIRQAVSDPMLAKLAKEGREMLKDFEIKGRKIDFQSNGSLLLAKSPQLVELKKIKEATKKAGIPCQWLSLQESGRLVPLLQKKSFDRALFCPSDASIDIDKLLDVFLKELKRLKVSFFMGSLLQAVQKEKNHFRVLIGEQIFICNQIVNAAGAWAGMIGKKAGAVRVPLKPYRRHLFESGPIEFLSQDWPFVWDLTHEFYFRPLKKGLLLSPCDRTLCRPEKLMGEKIDPGMKKILFQKLKHYSTKLKEIKIIKIKSGLRTMTSDGRFVIGEDPRVKGFFWVAGLGGHGVTTCLSVGRLTSDLMLGQKRDKFLVKALSPKRFLK